MSSDMTIKDEAAHALRETVADVAKDAIEILDVAIDLWNSHYDDEPDEVFTDLQRRFRAALAAPQTGGKGGAV